MRKLTALLVFIVVLAGAIALTRYYTAHEAPAPPERPEPRPAAPDTPPPSDPPAAPGVPPAPGAALNAPITFTPKLITLDFETGKGHTTVELQRDPARPIPASVWVWTYFFAADAEGPRRYCAGQPVEVRRPFAAGSRTTVEVVAPATGCAPPRTQSLTYYAGVSVSAESASAARLAEQQISYDPSRATPVVTQGARPRGR